MLRWVPEASMRAYPLVLVMAVGCDTPVCPRNAQTNDIPAPTGSLWGFFAQDAGGELLVTGGEISASCRRLIDRGALGQVLCSVVDFEPTTDPLAQSAWADTRLGVITTQQGTRLVMGAHILTLGDGPLATVVNVSREGVEGYNFLLGAYFGGSPTGLVIWSTGEPVSAVTDEPQRVAGVGRLIDDRVEAVGAPFYTGPARRLRDGVAGGRDPVSGHAWFDSPDGVTVLEIDEEGNIVRQVNHGTATDPSANRVVWGWHPLQDGRWVGHDATSLCTFDPLDRTTQTCYALALDPDPPQPYRSVLDIDVLPGGEVLTAWRVTSLDPRESVLTEKVPGDLYVGIWNGDTAVNGTLNDDRLEQCTPMGQMPEF